MEEANPIRRSPSPAPQLESNPATRAQSKPPRPPGLPPLPPRPPSAQPGTATNDAGSESSEPNPVPSCSATDDDDDGRSRSPSPTSHPHASVNGTISFVQHVLVIQQIREFVKALVRMDNPHLYAMADAVSTLIRNKMRVRAEQVAIGGYEEKSLTPRQVEALKVVLQTLQDASFFQQCGTATPGGTQAVTLLRATVFGSEASEASAVLASVNKARAFHYACLSLLRRCICVKNCFELLRLGHAISSADLKEAAIMFCVANFSSALLCSPMDWVLLEDEHVLTLLSNPYLKASSEWQVWESVVLWAMKDTSHRAAVVPSLLEYAVRLEELEVLQLQQICTNPLIKGNPKAADLVASAYTRRMLSSVHRTHQNAPKSQWTSGDMHGANLQTLQRRHSGVPAWRQDSPGLGSGGPGVMIQNAHLQVDVRQIQARQQANMMVPIVETEGSAQQGPTQHVAVQLETVQQAQLGLADADGISTDSQPGPEAVVTAAQQQGGSNSRALTASLEPSLAVAAAQQQGGGNSWAPALSLAPSLAASAAQQQGGGDTWAPAASLTFSLAAVAAQQQGDGDSKGTFSAHEPATTSSLAATPCLAPSEVSINPEGIEVALRELQEAAEKPAKKARVEDATLFRL